MYSEEEIKLNNTSNDAWMSYEGKILDVTAFMPTHPGGDSIMLPYLGKDIIKPFKEHNHSKSAERILESLIIGKSKKQTQKIDPYKGTLYQV